MTDLSDTIYKVIQETMNGSDYPGYVGAGDVQKIEVMMDGFPPESDYADEHTASYARHYLDGEEILDRLGQLVSGKIYCFSAHQHWHRIINGDKVVHCMTASMIEYPMEARVVSIENGSISVSTIETACPEIATTSLDSARWVCGRERDRHLML